MTDIPDEAVEAGAAAMFENQELELDQSDPGPWKDLPDDWQEEWRENVRNALTAAAPIIRADERRRIADELLAKRTRYIKESKEFADFARNRERITGFINGLGSAAQIAERDGK